jgi:DNA-binding transcriptional regulator YdaS (Cro superfamily)
LGKENKQINLIVDAFGGNTKMAQALNTYPALISQWKIRRSIPKSWWMQIEDAASKQNIPLTREDIMKADLR